MRYLLIILLLTSCCDFHAKRAIKCGRFKSDTVTKVRIDTIITGGDTARFHYFHDTTIVKNKIEVIYRDKYFSVKCPKDTFYQRDSLIVMNNTVTIKEPRKGFLNGLYVNLLIMALILVIILLLFRR
jgi:hypothetical protein